MDRWHDLLIPDIHMVIRKELDPVSALALALSCKEEFLFLDQQRPLKYGSLKDMLWYGHDALALRCYPKQIISIGTQCLARYGALMCLTYAHEHGARWHDETTWRATEGGHLSCLRYAHENGAPWDIRTTWTAAREGYLPCLKYAHENGAVWEYRTMDAAAEGGHLSCLIYAHEHGALWHELSTWAAAYGGNLSCLKYAHEHGAPWHPRTIHIAIKYKHRECAIYAYRNGAPEPEDEEEKKTLYEWLKE